MVFWSAAPSTTGEPCCVAEDDRHVPLRPEHLQQHAWTVSGGVIPRTVGAASRSELGPTKGMAATPHFAARRSPRRASERLRLRGDGFSEPHDPLRRLAAL